MASVAEKSGNDQKPFLITHPVNLRRRAEPPFPENSFGNFLWLTQALCISPMDKDLKDLANEVKRGISRIDKEFMKRLQADQGIDENLEDLRKAIPEEANWFSFNSWVNIGLYDVDFGWGRLIWLSGVVSGHSESKVPNNMATLMDTRSGDGIETLVILDEKYVSGFENNEVLQRSARLNPSALDQ